MKKLLTGFSGSAVLDADGLNAAASLMNAGEELPRPAKELILTPHPGEMSRLTGLSVEAVQADPGRASPAVCRSVECGGGAERGADRGRRPGWPRLCQPHRQSRSCPGRERRCAGRYDVGPAGLRSVRLRSRRLVRVWLHGAAADRAARQKGEYGMLPQDIFAHLGQMFAENDR